MLQRVILHKILGPVLQVIVMSDSENLHGRFWMTDLERRKIFPSHYYLKILYSCVLPQRDLLSLPK